MPICKTSLADDLDVHDGSRSDRCQGAIAHENGTGRQVSMRCRALLRRLPALAPPTGALGLFAAALLAGVLVLGFGAAPAAAQTYLSTTLSVDEGDVGPTQRRGCSYESFAV